MPGPLTGLIPACHTPFQRDGRLNLAIVPQQAELFRQAGLRSVFELSNLQRGPQEPALFEPPEGYSKQ